MKRGAAGSSHFWVVLKPVQCHSPAVRVKCRLNVRVQGLAVGDREIDHDGKISLENMSRDNGLVHLMPNLPGRLPDRHGPASTAVTTVAGVDRCR